VKLPRSLYESWLFKSTQAGLPGWQRSLLARALREDEALRCLAFELAEFNCGPAPEGTRMTDLGPRLRALIADDTDGPALEKPLFPSGWVPAGAIAVLLITGLIALAVKPAPNTGQGTGESSAQAPAAVEDLALPTAVPAPLALSKTAGAARPLTASAK
jgi:hypothetical protein